MPLTRLREFGPINAATSVHSVSGVPAYAVILSASRESDTGLLKVNAWTSAASKGLSSSPLNSPAHLQQTLCQSQYHGGFMNLPTFPEEQAYWRTNDLNLFICLWVVTDNGVNVTSSGWSGSVYWMNKTFSLRC